MTEFASQQCCDVPYRALKYGDSYFINGNLCVKVNAFADQDVLLEDGSCFPKPKDDDEVTYVKKIVAHF